MKKFALKFKLTDMLAVAAAAVVVLVTYFVALPQAQKLKTQAATLQTKEAEVARLQQYHNGLVEIGNRLPQYSRQIERLSLAYPKNEQTVEAMLQIQTMAERAGLALVNLTPAKPKAGSLPVTITGRGSYQALTNFLRELQFNIRPAVVRSLSVTAAGEKEEGVVLTTATIALPFAASVETPALPQPTEAPAEGPRERIVP